MPIIEGSPLKMPKIDGPSPTSKLGESDETDLRTAQSIDGHTVRLSYSRSDIEGLEGGQSVYGSGDIKIVGPGNPARSEDENE